MVIRDHRPKDTKKNDNKKDIRLVDVFDAGQIKTLFGLTQASILLFVLLVGGDYNTAGKFRAQRTRMLLEKIRALISYRTGWMWTRGSTRGNTAQ